MKRSILILLMAVCFFAVAEAQHCGWDFTSIIMVDVTQKGGDETIGGLKITLVDTAGRCFSTYNDSCLQFAQNLPSGNTNMPYVRQWELKHKRPSFPFLEEQYLVLVYDNMESRDRMYVKVEDTDGEANGGYFETILVPVKKENIISLCDNWCPRYDNSCLETVLIKIELGDLITLGNRKQRTCPQKAGNIRKIA